MNEIITYEQPLNDVVKICLRLEKLFTQLDYCLSKDDSTSVRLAVESILAIIAVVDRPELRGKLTQFLTNYLADLQKLEHSQNVDQQRLNQYIKNIQQLLNVLHASRTKLASQIRKQPLLEAIHQYTLMPGGVCDFHSPAYKMWLSLPKNQQILQLQNWAYEFIELRKIVDLVMSSLRNGQEKTPCTANNGYYQKVLNTKQSANLIQVILPKSLNRYAIISVGQHGLSIYFYRSCTQNSVILGERVQEEIDFSLACCVI